MTVKTEKKEEEEPAQPWGRFTLVSKDPVEERDHIDFSNKVTTIGRNKRHCDIVVNQPFISSVHCVVKLEGMDENGEPIVKLHDKSRNGIWVNAERVGKNAIVELGKGFTIHFTKPGTTPAGVTPMAFKLEFLGAYASHAASPKSEASKVPEDINMTVVADESFEATQLTDPPSPSEKKRKRVNEEPVVVTAATQELENKLKAAESQVSALTEELEQTTTVTVTKLQQEIMNLMAKLEEATAENLQLKTDLAAKSKDIDLMLKEATKKSEEAVAAERLKLKEELASKEKAVEQKVKETVEKRLKEDREVKAQEMAAKLKEATKKYQQKVEAEHFEQRREMSEKMAAFANENEKLQTTLGKKEEELSECEDKIATLKEKVTALEEQVSTLATKEKKLAEYEEKISELEEKVSASKDENSEILGLLAAAEEKVVVAENKAAEAAITAAAAASASNGASPSERHELQEAITSLRSELEIYRAQLAIKEEELKKQQDAAAAAASATTAATVSPPSIAADSIAQGDDAEALRVRLTAALNLFGQVQALGLQGMSLITGTNSAELGDLHLLSVASAESERTTTAVPNSPSSSPTEEDQQDAEDDPKDATEKHAEKKAAKKSTKNAAKESSSKTEATAHVEDGAEAEPKPSPSKSKWEKKKSNKQAAPLSAAIEADAVSAIAAMASAQSSGKSSPSDASTAVANGEGDGDWEMLE